MKRDRTVIWRRALTFRGLLPLMVVALTLALNSCTKGPMLPGEQPDKEYMDFSLELTPPGAYTQTKAMSSAEQNALNSAEVLVFKDNALLYHKTGTVEDIDGVEKRVQVTLKTSQTETDLFDIMVIGNPPAAFGFETYVGKTKDELKAAFNVSATGKWAGSEFVMYGEARQTLIKPTTNNFKIQMLRSLARVDIGVGVYDEASDTWAGLADFTLSEVRVVNSRDKFAAIPSATILNASGNVKVDAPTVPADAVAQGKDAATAIRYADLDITNGTHTASSIFIAEAPNTTDRVTLLIGGSYKGGATTYYRVDICVPRVGAPGNYDYLNILRNHLYRISITKVTAEGLADAQKALEASPTNITVDITATPEGGAGGDVIFDGNSYLMTDVSSVIITTTPDGVKSIKLFNVKAGFVSGTIANVTGTGITTPITLTSDVNKLISVVLPASITSGEYVITVGRLIKKIKFWIATKKSEMVDVHFDVLPYQNVDSMKIINPQPWITLSQNMTYLPSEQQSVNVVGNAQDKAYIHFDENIDVPGAPRTADVLVHRTDGSNTLVTITQRNLNDMVLGYLGGEKDNYGYTKKLTVELIEEFNERVYDDTSLGSPVEGLQWGFRGVTTNFTDRVSGLINTIELAKRTDSGITGPYTIYNNYAARYCYEKNRDINGNGVIDDSEVVWYLPALNQMMGLWAQSNLLRTSPFPKSSYWSATELDDKESGQLRFDTHQSSVLDPYKTRNFRVRCVRELSGL